MHLGAYTDQYIRLSSPPFKYGTTWMITCDTIFPDKNKWKLYNSITISWHLVMIYRIISPNMIFFRSYRKWNTSYSSVGHSPSEAQWESEAEWKCSTSTRGNRKCSAEETCGPVQWHLPYCWHNDRYDMIFACAYF